MHRLVLVLLITFAESFATTCLERGVYFYSTSILKFDDALNLWLALVFGVAYVTGALCSHAASIRIKEKTVLVLSLAGQLAVHLVMAAWSQWTLGGMTGVLFVTFTLLGFLNGIKWPVIESYVSAGWTPAQTAKAIGLFNVSWALAVPLGLIVTGPIVVYLPAGLFFLPALINLACIILVRPFAQRPVHMASNDPERPPAEVLVRLRSMLTASRFLMLVSYSLMWVLVALMPRIWKELGYSVDIAAGMSGVLDVLRLGAFALFGLWTGWHNRVSLLALSLILLPAGFFMVLSGSWGGTAAVLTGEILYGLIAGLVYYSALYYAMVVKNASVDAGGAHEGLIGTGFAIGPAAGLLGVALKDVFHSDVLGILAGVGPVVLLCAGGAIVYLARAGRTKLVV